WWTERRPLERGRTTLMRMARDGVVAEMTPAPFNVRSRVHEYGGGAFSVGPLGVFCTSLDDQQLHRIGSNGTAAATTAPLTSIPAMRFADTIEDPARNRLIAVREDHSSERAEA